MLVASSVSLLSPLKNSGGTFYTLSSTLNDYDRLFSGTNIKLVPSKFALLKLPDWANIVAQRLFIDPTLIGVPSVTDPNIVIPKVVQNYLENQLAFAAANRDDQNFQTFAEQSFWKMLRKLGALQLTQESIQTVNGEPKTIFTEIPASSTYDPVVKYIGDCNLLNHVSLDGQTYTELYLHVPTNSGKIDRISWTQNDIDWDLAAFPNGGGPVISTGLENVVNGNTTAIYDTSDKKYTVAEAIDNSVLFFDDIQSSTQVSHYLQGDYDFNFVLLYYDIWNQNDQTTVARNLYGMLFIDKFIPGTGGSYSLKKFNKVQPSATAAGNSFGFRINLKFSNASNQLSSEITINDYSTISMELYMQALQILNQVSDAYQKSVADRVDLNNRLSILESNYQDLVPNSDLSDRLRKLETIAFSDRSNFISTNELLQLFGQITKASALPNQDINIQTITGYFRINSTTGALQIIAPDGTIHEWQNGQFVNIS